MSHRDENGPNTLGQAIQSVASDLLITLVICAIAMIPLVEGLDTVVALWTGAGFSADFRETLIMVGAFAMIVADPSGLFRSTRSVRQVVLTFFTALSFGLILLAQVGHAPHATLLTTSDTASAGPNMLLLIGVGTALVILARHAVRRFLALSNQSVQDRLRAASLEALDTSGPIWMMLGVVGSYALFTLTQPSLAVTAALLLGITLSIAAQTAALDLEDSMDPEVCGVARSANLGEFGAKLSATIRDGLPSYAYLGGLIYLIVSPMTLFIPDLAALAEASQPSAASMSAAIGLALLMLPIGLVAGPTLSAVCLYLYGLALNMPEAEMDERAERLSAAFYLGGMAHLFSDNLHDPV